MGGTTAPSQPTNSDGSGSSNQAVIEEIALRYTNLSFDIGNMSYMSVFVQRGSGSVRVVVYGFVFLSCALTFIGITAILAKGISERKKDIGVLYGIGASDARITIYFLKETFMLTVPSAFIGTAAGFFLSELISSELSLVAFGKYIAPETSISIFLGVTILSILIATISCICCLLYLLKWNPSELISQSTANEKIQELSEALNASEEKPETKPVPDADAFGGD
jgi:ABC-type antimicrobial peptide transport system permease subunit